MNGRHGRPDDLNEAPEAAAPPEAVAAPVSPPPASSPATEPPRLARRPSGGRRRPGTAPPVRPPGEQQPPVRQQPAADQQPPGQPPPGQPPRREQPARTADTPTADPPTADPPPPWSAALWVAPPPVVHPPPTGPLTVIPPPPPDTALGPPPPAWLMPVGSPPPPGRTTPSLPPGNDLSRTPPLQQQQPVHQQPPLRQHTQPRHQPPSEQPQDAPPPPVDTASPPVLTQHLWPPPSAPPFQAYDPDPDPLPPVEPEADIDGPTTATRLELKEVQRDLSRRGRIRLLRRVSLVVLVLLLLGTAAVVGYQVTHHDRNGTGYRTPSGPQPRTQRTVLFQIRGADGDAVASALLAHDPTGRQGAVVLVPNRVVAQVPGSGAQPFGQAVGEPDGPKLSRSTLADLLGVRVDGSWVLDQGAFTRLIDALGGITADVDVDVIGKQGGSSVVLVPKGSRQQLTGSAALALLSYRAPGEDELQRLPRFQHVLEGLLAKLPATAAAFDSVTAALGKDSQVSDGRSVRQVLSGLRAGAGAASTSFQTMPVLSVDSGGEASYRLEPDGVARLVGDVLAASRLPGRADKGNRVLVLNGVGTPGIGQQVRDKIVPNDFVFVGSRNQAKFDQTVTVIVIFDTTSQSEVRASQLATALGLPRAQVQVDPRAQSIADLFVIVGSDFHP